MSAGVDASQKPPPVSGGRENRERRREDLPRVIADPQLQ
jgi:hypothetical protein